MFPPLSSDDVPRSPLPNGFEWRWSVYSGCITVVHVGAEGRATLVAEIGTTFYGAYQALTGRHRRVHMRRCFTPLPRALRFVHQWTCMRAGDLVEEIAGRRVDPTLQLDPDEHDWREVRAGNARRQAPPRRSNNPHASKGVCRIERPSKGGLGP